ncbi:MAG: methyltransferase domain-containing protein [Deltaproteobacteria bacterium]
MAESNNITDDEKLTRLQKMQLQQGKSFPKVGIVLLSKGPKLNFIHDIFSLPKELEPIIQEIVIFLDVPDSFVLTPLEEAPEASPWKHKIMVFRQHQNLGAGRNVKHALTYCLDKQFDHVVAINTEMQNWMSGVPDLLNEAIVHSRPLVIGKAIQGISLKNRLISLGGKILLGLKVNFDEFSCRVYSKGLLKSIPFELNSENQYFDLEMLIQSRMLGIPITEVACFETSKNTSSLNLFKSLSYFLKYRLHQMGLVFDKKYVPKGRVLYTLKTSPYSSHGRILSQVKENSEVLDIGCGTGLLSQLMSQKGIRSVGIDYEIKENVWSGFDIYIQDDLEKTKNLPQERRFDYVLLADVLEHLRTPGDLLRKVRPLLKTEGKIIASTGNVALWYMRLSLLLGRFNYGRRGILDETHVKLYTKYSFTQLLTQAGFKVEKIYPTALPFEIVFHSTGRSKLLKIVDRLYYSLALLWPKLFAYQFVVVASLATLEYPKGESKISIFGESE